MSAALEKIQSDIEALLNQRQCPDPDMLWSISEIEGYTGKSKSTVSKIVNSPDFKRKVPFAKHVEKRWKGRDVIAYF